MKETKAQSGKINANSQAELNPSSTSNDDILKRLSNLEKEMKNKLDNDVFDNEVASLRAMIGNLEGDDHKKVKVIAPVASAGSNLTSKEISTLRDMIERMP